jgi:DNA-binding response OmpR family regulator
MNMALVSLDWRQETLCEPRPTILLGVDSETTAEALAAALRSDGYDVLEASNTTEVIDRFNDMWMEAKVGASLELVILHLIQPAWANLAMLEYIRKVDWAVPVVVVTDSDAKTMEETKRLGATIVFKYPYELYDLRTAVINSIPAP